MITLQQIKSFLNPFKGATVSTNGRKGLVPTPKIGDENKFLQGNGNWEVVDLTPLENKFTNLNNRGYFDPIPDITGQDLNTIRDTGNYNGSTLINTPNNYTGWLYVEVIRHSNNTRYVQQRVSYLNTSPIRSWQRICNNDIWGTWVEIPMIYASYTSSDKGTWYRKWSNGWIEQGGRFSGNSTDLIITLPTAFTTTTYGVYRMTDLQFNSGFNWTYINVWSKTVNQFHCGIYNNNISTYYAVGF